MSKFEKELPFAIIEEYMLRDDDSSYPMDSIRMVHLTGKLLMDHFREALQTIYARHPLLTMQAEDRGNLFFWVPAEEEPEIVCRNVDTDSEALNASGFPSMRPLDLFSGPGFRITSWNRRRGTGRKSFFSSITACQTVWERCKSLERF